LQAQLHSVHLLDTIGKGVLTRSLVWDGVQFGLYDLHFNWYNLQT